jgi:hypothetical protein
MLDSQFRIPGTEIRFGVDAFLGLFPLVGDSASALPAIYLIHRARRLGVPRAILNLMVANLLVDLAVGAVPLLGDFFDIAFKANRRNIALLRRHLEVVHRTGGPQAVYDRTATGYRSR